MKIRFSQNTINLNFSRGSSVQGLADVLSADPSFSSQVDAIRLVEVEGVLYTIDNRRLAAFQVAGVPVPFRMATPAEVAGSGFKFTSTTGGTSVQVVWPGWYAPRVQGQ
jgi:hypothetical protein